MLNIVDQKLMEDTGQHLFYFLVPPNVGHQDMAVESSALCVVISLHQILKTRVLILTYRSDWFWMNSMVLFLRIWGFLKGLRVDHIYTCICIGGLLHSESLFGARGTFLYLVPFCLTLPQSFSLVVPKEAKETWYFQAFSIGSKCSLHYCKYVNKALIVIFHLTCPNVPCPYWLAQLLHRSSTGSIREKKQIIEGVKSLRKSEELLICT